jgi:nucleoside-diphosphate-sugar epimerase
MTNNSRTLVTGAGGFIGGRVVEALLQEARGEIISGLRRWSTAVRIGRNPIEPVQCDIMNPGQLAEVMAGVTAVVHCAVGNATVTVEGTRNVLEAARTAGVRRVVHVSTVDVYGPAEGTVTEATPCQSSGREYGDSKLVAEDVCRKFAEQGMEVVMLRPTIVYGPFSDLWTVEPAERLGAGSWLLPAEACQGTCNLVYVDDLVRAILLALDAPGVSGKAYNINGPDRPTWHEYIEALNAELGLPQLEPPAESSSRFKTTMVDPVRAMVKAVYFKFEDPIMAIYKRSKPARRLMKWLQNALLKVPSQTEYDLYGRTVDFPTDRAEAELGYTPQVSMARGVSLSARWFLHEGVLGDRA